MEVALQTLLTCPQVAALLSATDYCQLELALSRYFCSRNQDNNSRNDTIALNAKLINDASRLAFRSTFFENVNHEKHHLLDHLLKPMYGETFKHLWYYFNFIYVLNNNYQHNPITQRITIFEIYVLLSFHFLQINAEYVIQLLNINQYPSKLDDIIYILRQFLLKLINIRAHYEGTSIQLSVYLYNSMNNVAPNPMHKINVIYREYCISHLLSMMGDYETASISINKISEKCKQHCLNHKDNNTSVHPYRSVIPLSLYFKQLYINLLYNASETYVNLLYSNTYVSPNESEAAMVISALQSAQKGIIQQTQWIGDDETCAYITMNVQNEIIHRLMNAYIECQQQYLLCKLCVAKSRANSLAAQSAGLEMMPRTFQQQLKGDYLNIFNETERILQNNVSHLDGLYDKLANTLQYIDKKMLFQKQYSREEWMNAHNFNSIKSVIKNNNNIIAQTMDKIKEFIHQKENEEDDDMDHNDDNNNNAQNVDKVALIDTDLEILYEIRFKIQTLMSSISILSIESIAVSGELFYCAASVNCTKMNELILSKTSLELTDASILKTVDAIKMLMHYYYSQHPFKDISLFLLIRMLKDLGKVCGFKRYAIWSHGASMQIDNNNDLHELQNEYQKQLDLISQTLSQSSQYLQFAQIICENLIGRNHAISQNISRLANR